MTITETPIPADEREQDAGPDDTSSNLVADSTDEVTDEPEQADAYSIYLAGPMSNIPAFNFPLFFSAADYLRNVQGWGVLSPAEKDLIEIPLDVMVTIPGYDTGDLATYCANSSFTMSNAMEWDLPAIQKTGGIVLLDGWESSTGARWERTVAEALGRDIWLLHSIKGDAESPDGWALEKDENPTQLTDFLRTFAQPVNVGEVLPELSARDHLVEVRKQIGHVPGIAAGIDRIESYLA